MYDQHDTKFLIDSINFERSSLLTIYQTFIELRDNNPANTPQKRIDSETMFEMIEDLNDLENTSFVVHRYNTKTCLFISEMLDLGAIIFSEQRLREKYYKDSDEEQSDNFIIFESVYVRRNTSSIYLIRENR